MQTETGTPAIPAASAAIAPMNGALPPASPMKEATPTLSAMTATISTMYTVRAFSTPILKTKGSTQSTTIRPKPPNVKTVYKFSAVRKPGTAKKANDSAQTGRKSAPPKR